MDTHATFKKYFERKKKSLPGFSLRALAQRLDVSPSFLSRALNGKKAIPEALQAKLAKALDIEPELLTSPSAMALKKRGNKTQVNPAVEDWSLADTGSATALRNWYYIAILELTSLSNFDGTAASICRRLKLAPPTVEVALRELQSLGLLKIVNGKLKKTSKKLRFTAATSTALIRKFHDDLLEKAQNELRTSLTEADFHQRLIAGVSLTASPDAIQAAKRKLAECLFEIANDLIASPGEDVYHLATLLFPLSKG